MKRHLRPPVSSTRQFRLPLGMRVKYLYNRMFRRHVMFYSRMKSWVLFAALIFSFYVMFNMHRVQEWRLRGEDMAVNVREIGIRAGGEPVLNRLVITPRPVTEERGPIPVVMQRDAKLETLVLNFTDAQKSDASFLLFTRYNNITIQYDKYNLKMPHMDSENDTNIFLRNRVVRELLQDPPTEKLVGQINLIKDGVFHGDTNCGYNSEMIQFRRNSALSRRAPIRDAYLVPLSVPESQHFQHFIDGALPKLMQVIDFIEGNRKVRLLIRSPMDGMIGDILADLGFPSALVHHFSNEYVRSRVQINTCITPPMHPALFQKARKLLRVPETAGKPHEERSVLLILRDKRLGKRFLVNGDDVERFLRERYHDRLKVIHGVTSLSEAREVFGDASIIIGVHGGALYNILFSPRDTALVEIVPTREDGLPSPPRLPVMVFWELAHAIGLNYWRLLERPQTHLGSVRADLNKLVRTLDKIDEVYT